MEAIGILLEAIMNGMKTPFVIYGYEISLWQIFLFTAIGGALCSFIGGLINGD